MIFFSPINQVFDLLIRSMVVLYLINLCFYLQYFLPVAFVFVLMSFFGPNFYKTV